MKSYNKGNRVNAKSIMGLLTLGAAETAVSWRPVRTGHMKRLRCEGVFESGWRCSP